MKCHPVSAATISSRVLHQRPVVQQHRDRCRIRAQASDLHVGRLTSMPKRSSHTLLGFALQMQPSWELLGLFSAGSAALGAIATAGILNAFNRRKPRDTEPNAKRQKLSPPSPAKLEQTAAPAAGESEQQDVELPDRQLSFQAATPTADQPDEDAPGTPEAEVSGGNHMPQNDSVVDLQKLQELEQRVRRASCLQDPLTAAKHRSSVFQLKTMTRKRAWNAQRCLHACMHRQCTTIAVSVQVVCECFARPLPLLSLPLMSAVEGFPQCISHTLQHGVSLLSCGACALLLWIEVRPGSTCLSPSPCLPLQQHGLLANVTCMFVTGAGCRPKCPG